VVTARMAVGGRLLLAGLLPGQWRHVAGAYAGTPSGCCRWKDGKDLSWPYRAETPAGRDTNGRQPEKGGHRPVLSR